jgi:hypothetical protein
LGVRVSSSVGHIRLENQAEDSCLLIDEPLDVILSQGIRFAAPVGMDD